MDFRRLEAFCKVYELRSFSRAAAELYLSQPTISSHVSTLERELKVRLFDRLGREVHPTPAGDILYRHGKEAFSSLNHAAAEIQLLQDRVAGDLFVGGSTIPANYFLPAMLAKFKEIYPDVNLSLALGDSLEIVKRVASGDLQLGVVGAEEDIPDLAFIELLQDELVIIAAPQVAGDMRSCKYEELRQFPWVMREPGSGTRKAFEKNLQQIGGDVADFNMVMTVEGTQAILSCVKSGVGLSIVSRLAADSLLQSGEVVRIECPDLAEIRRHFYCVYHERRHYFPAVRYFMAFLNEECGQQVTMTDDDSAAA